MLRTTAYEKAPLLSSPVRAAVASASKGLTSSSSDAQLATPVNETEAEQNNLVSNYSSHDSPATVLEFPGRLEAYSHTASDISPLGLRDGDTLAYAAPLITADDGPQQPITQTTLNNREKVRTLLDKFKPILRPDHYQYALKGIEQIRSPEDAQRLLGRIVEMAQAQITSDEKAAIFLNYTDALAQTIMEVALPPNPKEDPLGFAIGLAAYAVPLAKIARRIPGFEEKLAQGLNVSRTFLGEGLNRALKVPQGLTLGKYKEISEMLRQAFKEVNERRGLNLNMSNIEILTHGSRAARTAGKTNDIDFMIRVSPEEFDHAIKQLFVKPNPGSKTEETMLHAIETGKIQRGEIRMSAVGRRIEKMLGIKVDISIIRRNGPFDRGPYLPLK